MIDTVHEAIIQMKADLRWLKWMVFGFHLVAVPSGWLLLRIAIRMGAIE